MPTANILTSERVFTVDFTGPGEDFIGPNEAGPNFTGSHEADFTLARQLDFNAENPDFTELTILQTNVDILTNKMDEFMSLVEISKPNIICLQEVLPKNGGRVDCEIEFQLDGFMMYCASNMRRGSITYVSKSLSSLQVPTENTTDTVYCQVFTGDNSPLLICNVYRSPNSDQENDNRLCELISLVTSSDSSAVLICGDFNFKDIDWDTQTGSMASSRKFIECVQENFLTQHVAETTRSRDGQTESLLDLILTDHMDIVGDIEYRAPIAKSDHLCLLYKLKASAHKRNLLPKRRRYYKGNYAQIRDGLAAVDWNHSLEGLSVDGAWSVFHGKLSSLVEKYIPMRKVNLQRKRWLTREALKAVREKHQCHNRYRKHRTEETLEAYKTAKNQACRITREARKNYEKSVATNIKDNPKEFWSYIKSQTGTCNGIAPLKTVDGHLALEPEEKAECLNNFFSSVFTKERTATMPQMSTRQNEETTERVHLTCQDIQEEIARMKTGKSAGPDDIHPKVIKETCQEISVPLSIIFNKSLEFGQVPTPWKQATVVPIFKKGKKNEPGNYRPVSLTSVCCKLMERLLRRHLLSFLERTHFFNTAQHGFRTGRSCTTQLLHVMETWTKWVDDQLPFDCIYLDYRKAFDSVPHQRLLLKVKEAGIRGNLLNWIESFLTQRSQRVRVESSLSGWAEVTSGIPQGSVLGPSLFLIFINDLPDIINSLCALFADDTKVFAAVERPEEVLSLQEDLNKLFEWTQEWQLPFNQDKCKVIHYGRNNPEAIYKIGDARVTAVEEEKDLGVIFDPKLTFSRHHDVAIAKANSRIGLIKRSFRHIDKSTFTHLYKALVRPIVEYASVITNPILMRDQDRLEKVQRRATKMVEGMREKTYDQRLQELRLDSLKFRRKRTDVIQAYRIFSGIDDLDEGLFFERIADQRTRNNGYKVRKPACESRVRANTFSNRVVDVWNRLPREVVSAPTINQFKSALRREWRNDEDRLASA